MTNLYAIFHMNLAFSAIPAEDYPLVIERSYRPLLDLARGGAQVAVEASATTLREIELIDPSLIEDMKELWEKGKIEFIGSGLSQAIMPLIPAEVNEWNLEAGNRVYEELLGRRPKVALVNEQTFSAGLVDLYVEAGYEAIIMDWNNSAQYNDYPADYLYLPQTAKGVDSTVTVLWNHSIAFQKFQRFIHGQLPPDEYLQFLSTHLVGSEGELRAFPLYGNDAEIFDYRPGEHSASFEGKYEGEWLMMGAFMKTLTQTGSVSLALPSDIIDAARKEGKKGAFNELSLGSAETPLPCKKQTKYNPTRWAVTGRNSTHINTQCYKSFNDIKRIEAQCSELTAGELQKLKETLCVLWGSDFRTNTTDEKLLQFQSRMGWLTTECERLLSECGVDNSVKSETEAVCSASSPDAPSDKIVKIETGSATIELLKDKGLTIKSLTFPSLSEKPVLGTLAHGHYDDMNYGADFFSGHLINVGRDGVKVTDLGSVEPLVEEGADRVVVSATSSLKTGSLAKRYVIYKDEPRVDITYRMKFDGLAASSLRLGIFTILPQGFDRETLWYESLNGGKGAERFSLKGRTVTHDEAPSGIVSASSCLGATDGVVRIGDKDKAIEIATDKSELYSVPLISYSDVDDSFFLRVSHSIGETDETAYWVWRGYNTITFTIRPA